MNINISDSGSGVPTYLLYMLFVALLPATKAMVSAWVEYLKQYVVAHRGQLMLR
jgi:hypothetical protein